MYENMSTNAHVLSTDQTLTRSQIDALAGIEHEYVEGRGRAIPLVNVEELLHTFICEALGDCVCAEPRELTS